MEEQVGLQFCDRPTLSELARATDFDEFCLFCTSNPEIFFACGALLGTPAGAAAPAGQNRDPDREHHTRHR